MPIVLTAIAVILCVALFVRVAWYTFVLFMFVAQPLFLVAGVWLVWTAVRELRQKGVL